MVEAMNVFDGVLPSVGEVFDPANIVIRHALSVTLAVLAPVVVAVSLVVDVFLNPFVMDFAWISQSLDQRRDRSLGNLLRSQISECGDRSGWGKIRPLKLVEINLEQFT